jgi:Clustered mitochondria/WD domain, G-beta repeat/Translation initiation factor eIF3 subunit 135
MEETLGSGDRKSFHEFLESQAALEKRRRERRRRLFDVGKSRRNLDETSASPAERMALTQSSSGGALRALKSEKEEEKIEVAARREEPSASSGYAFDDSLASTLFAHFENQQTGSSSSSSSSCSDDDKKNDVFVLGGSRDSLGLWEMSREESLRSMRSKKANAQNPSESSDDDDDDDLDRLLLHQSVRESAEEAAKLCMSNLSATRASMSDDQLSQDAIDDAEALRHAVDDAAARERELLDRGDELLLRPRVTWEQSEIAEQCRRELRVQLARAAANESGGGNQQRRWWQTPSGFSGCVRNAVHQVLEFKLSALRARQRRERIVTPGDEEQLLHLFEVLRDLYKSFQSQAEMYARVVVAERDLPNAQKTVKQATNLPGVAGGNKYVVHSILLKFACDSHGIYGGHHFAAKAAGHELNAVRLVSAARATIGSLRERDGDNDNDQVLPTIHLPLVALIDVRGWRIFASSLLPIDDTTLQLGSFDGGQNVRADSALVCDAVRRVMQALNLKGHRAADGNKLIYGPIDCEVHVSHVDGKAYQIDAARLMPPEAPMPAVVGHASSLSSPAHHLCALLRPELVRANAVPLSSDAYSRLGVVDGAVHNAEVAEATRRLHSVLVPEFGRHLDSLPEHVASAYPLGFSLTSAAHLHGVNVRHFGRVWQHVRRGHWHQALAVEMIARAFKQHWRAALRRAADGASTHGASASPFDAATLALLNLALHRPLPGSIEESKQRAFLSTVLMPRIVSMFGGVDSERVTAPFVWHLFVYSRSMLAERLVQLLGVRIDAKAMLSIGEPGAMLYERDVLTDPCRVRHLGIAPLAEAAVLYARGRLMSSNRELALGLFLSAADTFSDASQLGGNFDDPLLLHGLADSFFQAGIRVRSRMHAEQLLDLAGAYATLFDRVERGTSECARVAMRVAQFARQQLLWRRRASQQRACPIAALHWHSSLLFVGGTDGSFGVEAISEAPRTGVIVAKSLASKRLATASPFGAALQSATSPPEAADAEPIVSIDYYPAKALVAVASRSGVHVWRMRRRTGSLRTKLVSVAKLSVDADVAAVHSARFLDANTLLLARCSAAQVSRQRARAPQASSSSTCAVMLHCWPLASRELDDDVDAQLNKDGVLLGPIHAMLVTERTVVLSGGTRGALECGINVWRRRYGADGAAQPLLTRVDALVGHELPVRALAAAPDGQLVASGSDDMCVRVWRDGGALELHGHAAPITDLDVSPATDLLCSGDASATLRLWQLSTATCVWIRRDSGAPSSPAPRRLFVSLRPPILITASGSTIHYHSRQMVTTREALRHSDNSSSGDISLLVEHADGQYLSWVRKHQIRIQQHQKQHQKHEASSSSETEKAGSEAMARLQRTNTWAPSPRKRSESSEPSQQQQRPRNASLTMKLGGSLFGNKSK